MRRAYCNNWVTDCTTDRYADLCGTRDGPNETEPRPFEDCKRSFIPSPPIVTTAGPSDEQPFLSGFQKMMGDSEGSLVCSGSLKMPLANVPPLRPLIPLVNDGVELYGYCFLPALYGAMGVVIYQLRVVLDPFRPNRP
jgi:hypothetical protein